MLFDVCTDLSIIWKPGKRMLMGILKHQCISKYINYCNLFYCENSPQFIFNSKQVIIKKFSELWLHVKKSSRNDEVEQCWYSLIVKYKQKSIVCGDVILHSFLLQEGCLVEKKRTGLAKWPSVYWRVIDNFFPKLISYQICYYFWSQAIKTANHITAE